jgi:hypothetical protein
VSLSSAEKEELEEQSDRNFIAFYGDELRAGRFDLLSGHVLRKLRVLGAVEKVQDHRKFGMALTPLGRRLLEEAEA